jgi:photosystem I P700 chlorophyll a apoprotein A1
MDSKYTLLGSNSSNALSATSLTWGGDIVAVGGKVAMMPISLGI